MDEEPDRKKLDDLGSRINRVKAAYEPEETGPNAHTQAGMAWRMVLELVVGMAIGLGIGYGLDRLFGTLPIFLMIFALLGFAAGVRTMMHTAAEMNKDDNGGPDNGTT